MKIVSFDLGAEFGVAHNIFDHVHAEHWSLTGARQPRLGGLLHKLDCLFNTLRQNEKRLSVRLSAVFYERPFARGAHATRSLWGMAGLIEAVSAHFQLPAFDMPPLSIKKFAAGNHRASKEDMIAAAKRFGYTGNNEHEADAICGLKYAEATLIRSLE